MKHAALIPWSGAAFNLDLCSRSPITYNVTSIREVVEDLGC